jgi:hypothetical protein
MLTAYALTKTSLRTSLEKGASYYTPKAEMDKIHVFLADILESEGKGKKAWAKWYKRLRGYWDKKFGLNWEDEYIDIWDDLIK